MLKRAANVDITFVPFTGYTPAIQALLSNQITSALADLTALQGQLQTGKLRALATTARRRPALARCADRRSQYEDYGRIIREISFKRE